MNDIPLLIALMLGCMGVEAWAVAHLAKRADRCASCVHCKAKAEQEVKTQAEALHHFRHKGAGYRPGDPDRFPCPDEKCVRNPKR